MLCSLAFVATAVLLTVIQPPISFSWLAWVAWVPFVLVCSSNVKFRRLALIAYLVSLCYWLGNLYWIAPVTVVGWFAFCLYTAVLWPMLAFGLQYCRLKKIPLVLAVPVLIVGVERLQGLFLGGFLWRHLSHSQYANITLIQIADIFGAAGVSFLIAMVNGLVAELILDVRCWKNIFKISNLLKTCLPFVWRIALVCAMLIAAVMYGRWRVRQSDETVKAGPLVGSLQSNIPQSVKRTFQQSDRLFAELMEKSKAAASAGAELIIWPETMVQALLDPKILALLAPSEDDRLFDEILREHSKNTAFVLVGAYGGTPEIEEDGTIHLAKRYNSAFLYRPDGQQYPGRYNKIHLVPFGEFIPFRKKLPILFNLLMKFTPYNYDYTLDAGSEYTVFEMTGKTTQSRGYKFSVMICYEDTVPAIARGFAPDKNGQKQIDWLVNISNDGWFVRFKDDKVFASTELVQHMAVCVFRAVENRLSVVRSVNTGISCLIDSAGRVRNGFEAGDLPAQAEQRRAVAGWFVDRVPIDKRTTFFSRYGQWLDFCCAIGFVWVIIVPLWERFVKKLKS